MMFWQDMVAAEPQQPTADEINTTRRRGDLVQLVRKHWKCSHVECSARHNWRVVQVFKELMLQVINYVRTKYLKI